MWPVWRSSTSAVTSRRLRGFDGRSTPTEIIPCQFFIWPPPSLSLTESMRRIPQSRPVSPSTRPSPSLASAPLGPRGPTTRPVWPSLSAFLRACARPESPSNDRRSPPKTCPLSLPHGASDESDTFLIRSALGDVLTAGVRSDAAEARVVARHGRALRGRWWPGNSHGHAHGGRRLRRPSVGAPDRGRLRRPSEQ